MIRRIVPENRVQDIKPFLDQLRSIALKQPGYIYGETLRSCDNPEEYLVISTWRTAAEWNDWFNHPERKKIQNLIDDLTSSQTEYKLYQH
jgi:heme-degrading monooxygenase HmoA